MQSSRPVVVAFIFGRSARVVRRRIDTHEHPRGVLHYARGTVVLCIVPGMYVRKTEREIEIPRGGGVTVNRIMIIIIAVIVHRHHRHRSWHSSSSERSPFFCFIHNNNSIISNMRCVLYGSVLCNQVLLL